MSVDGWPVDQASCEAAGIVSHFSREYTSPNPKRTRTSQTKAIGNSMNLNSIGSIIGAVLVRCPLLVHWDCRLSAMPESSLSLTPDFEPRVLIRERQRVEIVSPSNSSSFGDQVARLRAAKRRKLLERK